MFQRPLFGIAEIAWRWTFGLSAIVLLTFASLQYLNSLPVSRGNLLLLRSGQPGLIWQALLHILKGSGPRIARATALLASALSLAWLVLASIGRLLTLASIREYVGDGQEIVSLSWRSQLTSLAGLNFLRLAAAWAAGLGLLAAWRLGAAASSTDDPSPGSALLVFLTTAMFVAAAWLVVNWFLSLATIFVAGRATSRAAIAGAADLCCDRPGAVLAATTWFGVAHLVAFVLATSAIGFPLAFLPVLPGGVVLGGIMAVTLLYFAVADFLYTGRLVAYVTIMEAPEELEPAALQLPDRPPAPSVPEQRVDPEELILSDVPMISEP